MWEINSYGQRFSMNDSKYASSDDNFYVFLYNIQPYVHKWPLFLQLNPKLSQTNITLMIWCGVNFHSKFSLHRISLVSNTICESELISFTFAKHYTNFTKCYQQLKQYEIKTNFNFNFNVEYDLVELYLFIFVM